MGREGVGDNRTVQVLQTGVGHRDCVSIQSPVRDDCRAIGAGDFEISRHAITDFVVTRICHIEGA